MNGTRHCPGYAYRLNSSLAEIQCPVGECGLEGFKEQHQLVTWEIQLAQGAPGGDHCSKIVFRSDNSFEWHEVHRRNSVVYTANNVTTNTSICKRAMVIQDIDRHSGSLILYDSIYSTRRSLYHTANAVCSVYRENCSSSKSMQITIPPAGEHCSLV